MNERMVRCDVENETGDSHMVTMVTKDMYAVINLMNDYNLTWEAVYNIIREAIDNASIDCLDCKNVIRSYDDYGEIADIHCRKKGELIQNGMCGYCKDYEGLKMINTCETCRYWYVDYMGDTIRCRLTDAEVKDEDGWSAACDDLYEKEE